MQTDIASRLPACSSTRTVLTQRPWHSPVAQSSSSTHVCSGSHGWQPLPQSTSLSLPFFTPSSQRAGTHASALQTPLAQSAPTVHSGPVGQGGQLPPQSTAVSSPFCTKSPQVGFVQTCCMQTPLWQLSPTMHEAKSAHGAQPEPPQSTSVSA